MDDTPETVRLPADLRFLKALVIILMLTMIGGVIAVVALLVTRMPAAISPTPPVPDQLVLPEGAEPAAVTQGGDWFAVVTTDGRILIFNHDGTLRQEVDVAPAGN